MDGHVLVVTIERPAARNAVNAEVSARVAAAMDRLDAEDGLRVAILTGAGGNFSAGMDLKALPVEGPATSSRGFGGITSRPPSKPVIAAVEGYALAGGFEIALACDLIVAARDAVFGIPEVKRGLIASSGGLIRLSSALPHQTAMRVALTGEPVNAEELGRLGLVSNLTSPGQALREALRLARAIGANAPLAVAASKRLVRMTSGREDLWTEEAELARAVMASEDAVEGPRAFVEKRPAVWRGR